MSVQPITLQRSLPLRIFCCVLISYLITVCGYTQNLPPVITLSNGWQLQEASRISAPPGQVSGSSFTTQGWYQAIVPGTILTSLVHNKVYPDPLFGENNRPNKIPESLNKTPYWYRTTFKVPETYRGKNIWLRFDGINYAADVWVNSREAGTIKGAFKRGIFDISALVKPGETAVLAVLVHPQPTPGISHEHTISRGMGPNGGASSADGPTFLCSMGWDWLPAIRDRNTGIWQKVTVSATGSVTIKDPFVTSDLKMPGKQLADIAVSATLENTGSQPVKGVFTGYFGDIRFEKEVTLTANSTQQISLNTGNTPQLRIRSPKLWWPNGYGSQHLYTVRFTFDVNGVRTDEHSLQFGIRKITYTTPDSDNLTLSVNGVRIFCKGGNWGMDEGLKRIPRERLETQIRMHKLANYNMIRNWVGQSTSEDLYQLCDQYGMLLWDEFFQPNPGDGPNPTDIPLYIANVRDKILRFRNHASIAVWCARNEGHPPPVIDEALRKLMTALDTTRLYQPSSTDGRGVNSGGPYQWQTPASYYNINEAFKTEIGSVSIPTLESVKGMLAPKDHEVINDAWAQHDFANGAQNGNGYRTMINERYGKVRNLADFVRKSQLANYEAFRAMYEGRQAKLFEPCTGVLTWMSNPAQPSFVWQLYHHDLEPNASLFATRKACEPLHIQLNEKEGAIQVINHLPVGFRGHSQVAVYDLEGKAVYSRDDKVSAAAGKATTLELLPDSLFTAAVHFIKLELRNQQGKLISDNFYWKGTNATPDNLHSLNNLSKVKINIEATRTEVEQKSFFTVTLHNPGSGIALMTHLQLRKGTERVLPAFYTDNYVSLLPGETKTVTIEAARLQLLNEMPAILVDGWNIDLNTIVANGVRVKLNTKALPENSPATGLPLYHGPALNQVKIDCGADTANSYEADNYYTGGSIRSISNGIDLSHPLAGPQKMYQTERFANSIVYTMPVQTPVNGKTYTVRLHWTETIFAAAGKRIFDVSINNKTVLTAFDIFREAGSRYKALVKEFSGFIPNENGTIEIKLTKGAAAYPTINGIEIIQ